MPLRLLPDLELVVLEYLRGHPDVAKPTGPAAGIYTELPHEGLEAKLDDDGVLVILRVTGREAVEGHLLAGRIQISAWASRKKSAQILAETARAALREAPAATHDEAVVTAVVPILDLRWEPDPETKLPRYLFEVEIYAHPHPS